MRSRVSLLFGLLLGTACDPDPADISVSLIEPATASPQYFHGNCFAGFSVVVELSVRETRRVTVFITSLSYRLSDRASGSEFSAEVLDRQALEDRYGAGASVLPGSGSKQFRLVGVTSGPPVGPIAVTGEIDALDENDQRVVESFQLTAPVVVNDPGPPGAGACSLP